MNVSAKKVGRVQSCFGKKSYINKKKKKHIFQNKPTAKYLHLHVLSNDEIIAHTGRAREDNNTKICRKKLLVGAGVRLKQNLINVTRLAGRHLVLDCHFVTKTLKL